MSTMISHKNLQEIGTRDIAYNTRSAGELANANLPEEEWIVEELIADGKVTILAADTGVGKSMLAEQIGIAVASGLNEVLGFKIPSEKRVLFINLEMTDRDFQKRLLKMNSIEGVKGSNWEENLTITSSDEEDKTLLFDNAWDRIEATIELHERYHLIIVDNLYTSLEADQESNKELKRVIQKMEHVAKMKGSAILLIGHHIKHNKDRDYLITSTIHGASALQNYAQIIIQIAKSDIEPGLVLFRINKNRFSKAFEGRTFGITMDNNTCWFHWDGIIEDSYNHLVSTPTTHRRKKVLDNFGKRLTRKEVVAWYLKNGKTERAADKALATWIEVRLVDQISQGVYEKIAHDAKG